MKSSAEALRQRRTKLCFDDYSLFVANRQNSKKTPRHLAGWEDKMNEQKNFLRFAYQQNGEKIIVFLLPQEWREVFEPKSKWAWEPDPETDPTGWVSARCA